MAFTSETKKELENYISGHLPNKEWYESHFYPFIENKSLRDRLIVEFINARKIYKFFEGLQASDELLLAQIKTQVIMYVSIQEAVVPIIYSMDVEPLDNDVAYQMVMKKYMSNERSINREQELKNENGDYSTNINYERRKQQRDTEEMLDRISSFDERLLYVGITIVVKAGSMEELEERTEKVRIIGKTHNMDIVPHSYRQLDALNTSLPTGARFVDTMRTITSEELSIFIPFNAQEIHDDLGYCYGFNKVSKNLIIGNRKLLKNGNGMVFGVPGSGKSYNEKSEMGQVLCFSKDDIIVVDPMGEYKDIAAAWGGQYINLTQSAENVFYVNPFHVPDVVPDIDRFVAEKAEFAYLYRNEPELNRCTEKPFYENNGFQFRIYAFAGSGNNGQGSGRRFV